jgi:hypothetical protein
MRRRRFALLLGAAFILTNLFPSTAGAKTDRKREHPRLECQAVDGPAVACKWSASDHPGLAGYRLFRAQRWMGQVVYRGKETTFLDKDVKPGGRYFYVVQAVGTDGRPVGRSNAVKVKVPPHQPKPRPAPAPKPRHEPEPKPRPLPEPKPRPVPVPKALPRPEPKPAPEPVEPMRLACKVSETSSSVNRPSVVCEWSAVDGAAGYVLWRSDEGAPRQAVHKTRDGLRFVDTTVAWGHTYRYAVAALNSAGQVVARSEVVLVAVPPTRNASPQPAEPPSPPAGEASSPKRAA